MWGWYRVLGCECPLQRIARILTGFGVDVAASFHKV